MPPLTLEASRERVEGGGGVKLTPPFEFFGFKFKLLEQLQKALVQLFFVCLHTFCTNQVTSQLMTST